MLKYLKFAGLLVLPLCFALFFHNSGTGFTLYSQPDLPKFALLLGLLAALVISRSIVPLFSYPLVLFCGLLVGISFLNYSGGRIFLATTIQVFFIGFSY